MTMPSPPVPTPASRPLRGFARPGAAAAAAAKGHALGRPYCHEWTSTTAKRASTIADRHRRFAALYRAVGPIVS